MKVHHVGYLVKDVSRSVPAFLCLGYEPEGETVWDESRKAAICFLRTENQRVELIAPDKDSPLFPLLGTYKNAPYHLCYRCEDMDAAIESLTQGRYMLFQEPAPAPAISPTARVAFLMHARAGIVELLEDRPG